MNGKRLVRQVAFFAVLISCCGKSFAQSLDRAESLPLRTAIVANAVIQEKGNALYESLILTKLLAEHYRTQQHTEYLTELGPKILEIGLACCEVAEAAKSEQQRIRFLKLLSDELDKRHQEDPPIESRAVLKTAVDAFHLIELDKIRKRLALAQRKRSKELSFRLNESAYGDRRASRESNHCLKVVKTRSSEGG